jgi:starch phosphorylase
LADQSFAARSPAQPIDELALAEIKSAILAKLRLAIGKDAEMATRHDWYKAAAQRKSRATMPGANGFTTSAWNS